MMKRRKNSKHHSYKIIRKVGSGNFGEAFLVESTLDQRKYIMKKLKLEFRTPDSKEQIFKEVKVMQTLNHCYIIKYVESFVNYELKEVCIVMEYAANGDLEKYLENRRQNNHSLSEDEVIQWFVQICLGLKYIHQKKIVHRDIKPDNIFIDSQNELKIGDFGISKIMNETFDLAKTKIGTPFVMAPQIWEGMKYNQKSDIWSLGCVLYKMMTLKYPFQAENSSVLMMKVLSSKGVLCPTGDYSQSLKELTVEMLNHKPEQRPSVHKILEMPFIKKYLVQILDNTINLHDQNLLTSHLMRKNDSSKLFRQRRSLSSLSSQILTPKSSNKSSTEYLKVVEFKQNYPMILEENKHLKADLEHFKTEKEVFEQKTETLLDHFRCKQMTKEEIIAGFHEHILNFLYP